MQETEMFLTPHLANVMAWNVVCFHLPSSLYYIVSLLFALVPTNGQHKLEETGKQSDGLTDSGK
jgi:hypothetical protein